MRIRMRESKWQTKQQEDQANRISDTCDLRSRKYREGPLVQMHHNDDIASKRQRSNHVLGSCTITAFDKFTQLRWPTRQSNHQKSSVQLQQHVAEPRAAHFRSYMKMAPFGSCVTK